MSAKMAIAHGISFVIATLAMAFIIPPEREFFFGCGMLTALSIIYWKQP
jgi:hypothetical protein